MEVKFLHFTRTGDISMPVDSDKFHTLFLILWVTTKICEVWAIKKH